ncbi:EAL and modified HD-GYP domain-containing signal transduction protein [Massilia aurea]|uniref:EAL and modified HD-GYP domain-containing signal transduction protein n=1 Tax=Massilia aurea TaxID=373040 RepID=A0A7W9X3R2_9BURK|nr:HDOD domain-containing protein [Massilia aurea]MBB6135916.1 EAL and modified HD-GYP domain-containing signal transduction protein [Massilia aurea]
MTDTARLDEASQPLRMRNFFLARQPVLDRNQALYGYELLFRGSAQGPAEFESGLSASASVIHHASQLGLPRAIGDATAFINVDKDALMSDMFAFMPRERTVLDIVSSVEPDVDVIERMTHLASHGFRFAAEASAHGPALSRFLPVIDFVKMDLRALPLVTMLSLAPRLRNTGKRLVAAKVENLTEYRACLDVGFDYFQGYYFAKPSVIAGRKLSPSQTTVLDLMNLIMSDADNAEIEQVVKREVTIGLNLLRLVNTPAVGAGRRIESISQALNLLGRRQLQRWLQILLFAEPDVRGHSQSPLLMLATTRARLMELLAQRMRPAQRNVADIAFTVGMMSLMDTLFCIPMRDIVEQIPVIDEVRAALLNRTGFFGELLKLAESIERMDDEQDDMLAGLKSLAFDGDDLAELEVAAFEWSDKVVRYAI